MPSNLPNGWVRVSRLTTGEPLEVRERFARSPTYCALLWIDSTAVACMEPTDPGHATRIVIPAAQVYSVRRHARKACFEDCHRKRRLLIGAGVGALLGGLAGRAYGAGPIAIGSVLGAGIGAGFASGAF